MNKLYSFIQTLHQARVELEQARVREEELEAKVEALPIFQLYQEAIKLRKDTSATAEALAADVRSMARQMYAETGVKKYPGVDIAIGTTVSFDPAQAKEYCLSHGLSNFLGLDNKSFSKWLLTNAAQGAELTKAMGLDKLSYYITDDITPRIAPDLSKAIFEIASEPVEEVADGKVTGDPLSAPG